ncbi:MAG: hypothetical protein ACI9AD_000587 [Nitriliruptoraceae bacterium]|jgi:hypothetical protein
MANQGRSLRAIGSAAAGVVLGCSVLFGVVGLLRNGTSAPEVAASAPASEVPTSAAGSAVPAASAAPSDGLSDLMTMTPSASPTAAPSAVATAEATESPIAAGGVTPGDVTIQVLDATGTGTKTAGNKVADQLRAAGYQVVVVNSASKVYTETTVFWSEGQEAAGRQVAAAFSFPDAMPTPVEVRLSNRVSLHVVVGTDQS